VDWDAFVSHASEDKDQIARPLAAKLTSRGLKIWYDECTLTVGDSLRRSIDNGLAHSHFGIVIISRNFLLKEWPQKELDGLVSREIGGVKVILPVWHEIGADEIRNYSPMLADRLAASSRDGLDRVTDRLIEAMNSSRHPGTIKSTPAPSSSNNPTARPVPRAFCRNCGAIPGPAVSCPSGLGHSFISGDPNRHFCRNCGARPGPGFSCPSGLGHHFISGNPDRYYCKNCGAIPGTPNRCPSGLGHYFISF
jgi:TIR domain